MRLLAKGGACVVHPLASSSALVFSSGLQPKVKAGFDAFSSIPTHQSSLQMPPQTHLEGVLLIIDISQLHKLTVKINHHRLLYQGVANGMA